MKWRVVLLVVVAIGLLASVSCAAGGDGDGFDVPPSLRSRAASEFPEFSIVSADGTTMEDSSSPEVEQDVQFTLRHKQLPFYIVEEYDRSFARSATPPSWILNESSAAFGSPSFKGTLDAKARSFVEFFSQRYPRGDYVFEGANAPGTPTRFDGWLFPRERPSFGCSTRLGRAETYVYDPKNHSWRVP